MNFPHSWHRYLALLALAFVSVPAFAQVSISLDIAPPPLVVEDQPPCPTDGLIWTPGYWAYDDNQGVYYWVDGEWVQPPEVGFLWTPAYWGWENNVYVFHSGYWGPTVGFYGGVNYGHGYGGHGYHGGRWDNGHFAYNTAVNNVGKGHFANTYADRSAVRPQSSRVSYNGGKGGITARPTAQEQQGSQGQHVQATAQQQSHFQQAQQQRSHEVKVDKTAAKQGPAPGAQPNARQGGQPVANRSESPFTGGDNHKEPPANRTPATVHNAPQPPHREPVKPEATHTEQPKPVEQPHAAMEQHAAPSPALEEHHAEGPKPGANSVPHQAAPVIHPAGGAQAHHEQKPAAAAQAKPAAKPQGGQGNQGGQGGGNGGGGDHHDGH